MARPDDLARSLQAARKLQAAGKLREAEALYRAVLARQPYHAHALHGLGLAMLQAGHAQAGADLIQRAIALNPGVAEFHDHMGLACRRLGRPADALACHRQALALQPGHAEAHRNIGVVLYESGEHEPAIEHFRRAVARRPDYVEALNNLGFLLNGRGQHEEALAHYRRALAQRPRDAALNSNAGAALKALGRPAEAMRHYEQALRTDPEFADARVNLGIALTDQRRFDEATACYERVLAAHPRHAEAHHAYGVMLAAAGRAQEAVARFRTALDLKPQFFDAHVNVGNVLLERLELREAAACYRNALSVVPGSADARLRLANVRQHLCDWGDPPDWSGPAADVLAAAPTPFMLLTLPSSPADQLACARHWAARRLAPFSQGRQALGFETRREQKRRLRIGYLSADFHGHATAHLVAELLELHERAEVEVTGYSYGRDDGSPMRRRIVAACDRFVDLASSSHLEAAGAIYRDGTDILVDLKGHTSGARPEIVALRPAPVQVSYLGYPGTMGADCYDYIVTDRFVTPPADAQYFSEQLACLPECYQPNDRQRAIAHDTPARAELGLPKDGFVFCCFNNSYKITPEVFALWMRLLGRVPGSVLWLLDTYPDTRANLERAAAAHGIAPQRLVFAPRLASPEHLARHRRADLFLDTLPCNAHTTASDALWAGLPLLTCAGQTFCSRVAGSLLHAVGLPGLVTGSLPDYEALALRLAGNPGELSELRARLAENRLAAPLFDSRRYARHLEAAFRMMWDRHAGGAAPAMLEVPRLP